MRNNLMLRKIDKISELIECTAKDFEAVGIDSPRRHAEELLAYVLDVERLRLYIYPDSRLSDSELMRFNDLAARRKGGESLQYITGIQNFFGLDFEVTPDVLIPRHETEILVEKVCKELEKKGESHKKVIDLGTGSGNIAVSIAAHLCKTEMPDNAHQGSATIWASDISCDALRIAKRNARRHGVSDRINFTEGDLFSAFEGMGLALKIDAVVSNPPYVDSREIDGLQVEVRDHEPRLALDGGCEGLEFYPKILDGSLRFLDKGGILALEIGPKISQEVVDLFGKISGYKDIQVIKDYAGLDRIVMAIKT